MRVMWYFLTFVNCPLCRRATHRIIITLWVAGTKFDDSANNLRSGLSGGFSRVIRRFTARLYVYNIRYKPVGAVIVVSMDGLSIIVLV